MQQIIKNWLKYFIFAGLFTTCMNLIYLGIPFYMMAVYDRALFSFSKASLFTLSAGLLIALLFMALLDLLRARLLSLAGSDIACKMRPFVHRQMHKDAVSPAQGGYDSGDRDLETVRAAMGAGRIFSIIDFAWIPIFLAVLYMIHPLPGLVACGAVFLAAGFQMLLYTVEKRRYAIAGAALHSNEKFSAAVREHAGLVSSMKMERDIESRILESADRVAVMLARADRLHATAGAMVRMIHLTGPAAVFCAGAFVFIRDEITVGTIFAGVMITIRVFQPLERALDNVKPAVDAAAALKRLKLLVGTASDKERLSLPEPQGKLDVAQMTLALGGKPVLANINFSLEPGESLGIFGPSCVGKTALCRALLGVWEPMAGEVRLDKAKISHWPGHELGQYLGYMPQEPELLPGTVAENISRFGQVDADETVKAAQAAGIHELILKLPQGYDTRIQSGGKNLAAGLRQLISLARALYKNPRLVVLDEPFTHLDEAGLKRAAVALNMLKQAKVTQVVVARQPNLLASMDKVLMLKEGQVAMYGPSKEVFAQIAKQQQAAGAAPQQIAGVRI